LDSVVSAIVKLEDSGLLDAGKGSYLNAAGFVENDASLMQGNTGNAGAVAAMPRLRNPIVAARIAAVPGSEWLLMAVSGLAFLRFR
jgi:beta-aspartyl-peptidase (threonine type)